MLGTAQAGPRGSVPHIGQIFSLGGYRYSHDAQVMVSSLKVLDTGHPPRARSFVVAAIHYISETVEEYRITHVIAAESRRRPVDSFSDSTRAGDALRRAHLIQAHSLGLFLRRSAPGMPARTAT